MDPNGWRQQPGFACEECRRRKARCDRQQPRCGSCIDSGVDCVTVTQRPRRGPKKGQIDMMRSRIAMLECELRKQNEPIAQPSGAMDVAVSGVTMRKPSIPYADINMIPDNFLASLDVSAQPYLGWPTTTPDSEGAYNVFGSSEDLNARFNLQSPPAVTFEEMQSDPENLSTATSDVDAGSSGISDLMLADLDDVYFDRVQSICPMIHQRRYFAWASQNNASPAQECLRSAMRTLAAAMSAPYRDHVSTLYSQTRSLLEESKQIVNGAVSRETTSCIAFPDHIPIQYIQAWLLLAHYESLRINEWQAMLTAGHAFRLVQMARLYEDAAPETTTTADHVGIHSEPNDDFSAAEERRRTFWVAYNLDCFLSWRSEQPLMLYEDMVNTRLPAPEANFQNSQPVTTSSLPESLTADASIATSAFAECVVLATLHSRCMAHRRASAKESGKEPRGFWARHEWLASAAERRIKLLEQTTKATTSKTSVAGERDPMLFFTHMLAYSVIVGLGATVQSMPWQAAEYQLMAPVYEQRVRWATGNIVRLAKAFPSLSCFKAHPFLPNLLASAISLLRAQSSAEDGKVGAEVLLRLLTDLGCVNSLAQTTCSAYAGAWS